MFHLARYTHPSQPRAQSRPWAVGLIIACLIASTAFWTSDAEAAGPSVGSEAARTVITGRFKFIAKEKKCVNCSLTTTPARLLRRAKIEIWDDRGTYPLATDYLDDYGRFKIEVPNTERGGIDPHLIVYAEDGERVEVLQGAFSFVWGERYPASGPIVVDLPNTTYDIGTVTLGPSSGTQAFYIYDQIGTQAYGYLAKNAPQWSGSHDAPVDKLVTVRWPRRCLGLFSDACYNNDVIYLPQQNGNAGYRPDIILHEYGHFVHSRYIGNDQVRWACAGNGFTHGFLLETNPKCAWTEGWATFFSMVVRNRATFGNYSIEWDLENGTLGTKSVFDKTNADYLGHHGSQPHNDFEMVVLATLWDLFDAKNEDHDDVKDTFDGGSGLSGIWSLSMLGQNPPLSIDAFFEAWDAQRGLTCKESAIAAHHLLDLPPIVRTLEVTEEPSHGGSVGLNPQPSCGATGYLDGTSVELTAQPATGFQFSHWQGENVSITNPLTVEMVEDVELTANFCVPGDCPVVLLPTPDPVRLRGLPGETLEVSVLLKNPESTDVNYSIASLSPWLTVNDSGPGNIPAGDTVEVRLGATCTPEVSQSFGAYEVDTGSSVNIEYPAELLCVGWEIDPLQLDLSAEVEDYVSGPVQISSLGQFWDVTVDFDRLDISPATGIVTPGTPLTLGIGTTCPDTAEVRTFEVPLWIDDDDDLSNGFFIDYLTVTRTCVDNGATSSGDPHLVTFDDLVYDFQAAGEFVALRTDAMEVQVRQQQWGVRPASVNSAVAAAVGSQRVAFYRSQDPMLWVDGSPSSLADGATLTLADGSTVSRAGHSYTVTWAADGSVMKVWRRTSFFGGYLTLRLSPSLAATNLQGLFGDRDGDSSNDLALEDGTVLTQPVPFAELHGAFADSWRINTAAESLFDYPGGGGPHDFNIPFFPDAPASLADLDPTDVAWARSVCEDLNITDPRLFDACVLDVALTGDPSIGEATAEIQNGVFTEVYQEDFEGLVGSEWSSNQVSSTPEGGRKFLGRFSLNEAAILNLSGLASHSAVTVSFDLYAIESWDGDNTQFGPDRFQLTADGTSVLLVSIANVDGRLQSHPDPYGSGAAWPSHTGAIEEDTLGYNFHGDSVYRFTRTFSHGSGSLQLQFRGVNLSGSGDESWGIDNVTVTLAE